MTHGSKNCFIMVFFLQIFVIFCRHLHLRFAFSSIITDHHKIAQKWSYFGHKMIPKWQHMGPHMVKNGSKTVKNGSKVI